MSAKTLDEIGREIGRDLADMVEKHGVERLPLLVEAFGYAAGGLMTHCGPESFAELFQLMMHGVQRGSSDVCKQQGIEGPEFQFDIETPSKGAKH